MNNRVAFWVGGFLVLFGLVVLLGNIFNFNAWAIFWPLLLVLLGIWLVMRPRLAGSETYADFKLIGDVRRGGAFHLVPEDLNMLIGDINFDLTQAVIPVGETRLKMSGFIGDIDVFVPVSVGIRVISAGFVSETRLFDQHRSSFLTPIDFASSNYASAERKIFLELAWFIGDVTIKGR
jgi:lia operon protein LiaF